MSMPSFMCCASASLQERPGLRSYVCAPWLQPTMAGALQVSHLSAHTAETLDMRDYPMHIVYETPNFLYTNAHL